MRLLYLTLITFVLLAVTIDGAKKKKNNHRDRDEGTSRQQLTEDEQLTGRREEEIVKQKDNKRGRGEKEEKPLKKADDESSSEEEEEKKQPVVNASTIAPSRARRELYDQPLYEIHRSGRSRRAENTLQKAKEMDEIPLNNNNNKQEPPTRHRPRRAENTLKKAKEMDEIPLKPSNNEEAHKSRSRRSGSEHAQTGEVILTRAQELNDGEKKPLVIDETAGSRPDYRKKNRTRRANGEIVLGKAQELNGGERTEIGKDATATRPDYRKNSRTRRTLEIHRSARVERTASASSEENTLVKAKELNDGARTPVDAQPSQSQMPEKVKAHKKRTVRHLNQEVVEENPIKRFVKTESEEKREDTSEWKRENEEDYDNGGNDK